MTVTSKMYLCAIIPVTCLLAAPVRALEFEAGVTAESMYSTNARRVSSGTEYDITFSPGINFSAFHDTPELVLDAEYEFSRRLRTQEINGNRSSAEGYGNLLWHAIPNRLDFEATQITTETTRSITSRGTDDEKTILTSTSIGPTLRFPIRSGGEANLGYRISAFTNNEADTDSTTNRYFANYSHEWSATNHWVLEVSRDDIEYDEVVIGDVKLDSATLALRETDGVFRYDVEGGVSEYRREGRETVDGAIWDVRLLRDIGIASVIEVRAYRRISDQSADVIDADDRFIGDFFESFDNSDLTEVFTETGGSVSLERRFGRSRVELEVAVAENDYEDFPNDTERESILLSLERQLTPRATLEIGIQMVDVEEIQQQIEFRQYELYTDGVWNIGSNLSLSAGFEVSARRDGSVGVENYTEYRFLLGAEYRLFQRNR